MVADDADPRTIKRRQLTCMIVKFAGGPPALRIFLMPTKNLAGIQRRGQVVITNGQDNFLYGHLISNGSTPRDERGGTHGHRL